MDFVDIIYLGVELAATVDHAFASSEHRIGVYGQEADELDLRLDNLVITQQ